MKLELSLIVMGEYYDRNGNRKKLSNTEFAFFYPLIREQFLKNPQWLYCRDWETFIRNYSGSCGLAEKVESMEIVPVLEQDSFYARFIFQSERGLSEAERSVLADFVYDQFENGWGEQLGVVQVKVGGELEVQLCLPCRSPLRISNRIEETPLKYWITEIQHPIYRECHRIQEV